MSKVFILLPPPHSKGLNKSLAIVHIFRVPECFFLPELCFVFFFFLSFLNMIWNRKGKVLNYFLSLLNVVMESMYMIVRSWWMRIFPCGHVSICFCDSLKPCHSLKVGLVLYPFSIIFTVYMYVCICVGGCMCAMMAIKVRGQLWHLSSPSTFTWVPRLELGLQARIASILPTELHQ